MPARVTRTAQLQSNHGRLSKSSNRLIKCSNCLKVCFYFLRVRVCIQPHFLTHLACSIPTTDLLGRLHKRCLKECKTRKRLMYTKDVFDRRIAANKLHGDKVEKMVVEAARTIKRLFDAAADEQPVSIEEALRTEGSGRRARVVYNVGDAVYTPNMLPLALGRQIVSLPCSGKRRDGRLCQVSVLACTSMFASHTMYGCMRVGLPPHQQDEATQVRPLCWRDALQHPWWWS